MNIHGVDIAFFFKKTREVFSNVNGTPCRRSLGIIPPLFHFGLETQEPTTLSMWSFPGPRFLATVRVLLEFGDRHESFVPVHCDHASVFSALVPRKVASGLSETLQNMATLFRSCVQLL